MSKAKRWGGRLVRSERLSSGCSLALGGTSFGGGLAVGAFGTEIGKSSFVSTVVEGSSTILEEVFFLTWSNVSSLSSHL